MSQFIIATNNATVPQRNAITEYIQSKGWPLWHHFEDLWLVATSPLDVPDADNTTSQTIKTELEALPAIGPATYLLVIKVSKSTQPMTHFGFGPKAGWEWTAKYWSAVG
jgi:hypothetical protein